MIDLIIEASHTTPFVLLDSEEGLLEIKGRSTPESAVNFYFPLRDKIKRLFRGKKEIRVEVALEYFNTSSSKCLFDIFKTLREMERAGAEVIVYWCFEEDDDDMLESGEDYEDSLGMRFEYVPIELEQTRLKSSLVA